MVNVKEKAKELVNSAKEKVKKTKENVKEVISFFGEHPEVVMPILSGLGMLTSGVVMYANKKEKDSVDACLVEDDVTGLNFRTRHSLTNAEILELGDRMIDGQTKGNALNDMGLLKDEKKRR